MINKKEKTIDAVILNNIVDNLFKNNPQVKINFNITSTNRVVRVLSLSDVKATQKNIADAIVDKVNDLYPHIRIVSNLDGGIIKLKVITPGSSGRVFVSRMTKTTTTSPLLRPGVAYEHFFHSFIVDAFVKRNDIAKSLGLTKIQKENLFKIYLIISTTNGRRIEIGPINDTQQVGQLNKKTDESITLTTNKTVNLSLKQENFRHWSGGFTNEPTIIERHKSILKDAISKNIVQVKNNQIIFPTEVKGIRFSSTIEEVKKFAFAQGTSDEIRYIIKHAVEPKVSLVDGEITIYAIANNIYDITNTSDLKEVQEDMYGIIGSKPGTQSMTLSPYGGAYVMFVPKSYAFRKGYVEVPSS